MPPRALLKSLPLISHLPPRSLGPLVSADAKREAAIRRYAIHWLQHAAARVHKRSERIQRQTRFVASVLGIDHLFDVSDVPKSRTGLSSLGASGSGNAYRRS